MDKKETVSVIGKSSAISIGVLIPLISALFLFGQADSAIKNNTINIVELKKYYKETSKNLQEINVKLGTIEGYLEARKEQRTTRRNP